MALSVLGAALAVALSTRVVAAVRGAPRLHMSVRWFFLLPLVGFALQEHLERLLPAGSLPLDAPLEPAFLIGLGLQLPFALAALAAARLLLGLADELGQALARRPPSLSPTPLLVAVPPSGGDLPRHTVLALGYPQRGPPTSAG
jgi:hypothetical protein